jgi:hypothetical protein
MTAPHESVWGSINTCFEIGLEIYRLFCTGDNGEKKDGIAIPIDRATELLSDNTLAYGTETDGFIYFENPDEAGVPLHRLLKAGAVTKEDFIKKAGELGNIENLGRVAIPEHYGALPFPQPAAGETVRTLCNGVTLIKGEHDFRVAVHKSLAGYELSCLGYDSYEAGGYYTEQGDFAVYGRDSCAVPLFELSLLHDEINDVIVDRESLEQTLAEKFPDYVTYWNDMPAHKGIDINPNGSLPSMFLQEHYDYEAENTRNEVSAFREARAREIEAEHGLPNDVLELER